MTKNWDINYGFGSTVIMIIRVIDQAGSVVYLWQRKLIKSFSTGIGSRDDKEVAADTKIIQPILNITWQRLE